MNTGTMHLAAIAGAPIVGLNGPNADLRWGPRGLRARGIHAPGQGCGYLDLGWEFHRAPTGTQCMERITAQQVLTAVDALTAHT